MAVPEGYTKLGTVGIAYKGEYDDAQKETYKQWNWVTYQGSSFLVLKDTPPSAPVDPDETGYWKLIAKKGETGDKGDTGATPEITITVQTGEPGTEVVIEKTNETAETPAFDITIPKGDPGEVSEQQMNDAIAAAIAAAQLTIDSEVTAESENPVKSSGIQTALDKKQDKLTGTAGQVVGFDADGNVQAQKIINHWDVAVTSALWVAATGSPAYAGMTAAFQATVACEGMTAETDISGIVFTGGDRTAAATWQWLKPDAGNVIFYSATKPITDFNLRLTEVK